MDELSVGMIVGVVFTTFCAVIISAVTGYHQEVYVKDAIIACQQAKAAECREGVDLYSDNSEVRAFLLSEYEKAAGKPLPFAVEGMKDRED